MKTYKFYHEKQQDPIKYLKEWSNIFLRTLPTDSWCNMLQTLERRINYIGVILSDEHTPTTTIDMSAIEFFHNIFCLTYFWLLQENDKP